MTLSSANRRIVDLMLSLMSLMYSRKSTGPMTEPFCTNPCKKNPENILKPQRYLCFLKASLHVQHPLTVINSKFSQLFLNFHNRFFMKKKDIGLKQPGY